MCSNATRHHAEDGSKEMRDESYLRGVAAGVNGFELYYKICASYTYE